MKDSADWLRILKMHQKTYQYWPIRFEIAADDGLRSWFAWHGWQTGWKGFGHGLFGWTFHIGRILIMFGKDQPRHKAIIYQFPLRNGH